MLVEVQTMHAHLDVEYILRKEDGQVQQAIFSIEMGEINNEPHIQGMYTLKLTAEMSTADLKQLLKQEKTWLKLKLSEAFKVLRKLRSEAPSSPSLSFVTSGGRPTGSTAAST